MARSDIKCPDSSRIKGQEMSAKSEEYRRQAEACDKQVKNSTDPRHAEEYRRLAEEWRRMAAKAEEHHW